MKQWDIFCRVIDNLGDIGVCWRLAQALAARGQQVRLWVDDASALVWMAPDGCAGVQVMAWQPDQPMPPKTQPGDVVIEAFGCDIDHAWVAMNHGVTHAASMPAHGQNRSQAPVWINLEYLSAEGYAERNHGLRSPVLAGAASGWQKWFFYPGFTQGTGGLIREVQAIPHASALPHAQLRISLFCYEPPALEALLSQLAALARPCELQVTAGRAQRAVEAIMEGENGSSPTYLLNSLLSIKEQSFMTQTAFDALLHSCDLNFVRGEDSLVRALWSGRAFVWQIYPQQDGAHASKLEAFLDWLQAPSDLRQYHRIWNGLQAGSLPQLDIAAWTACTLAARDRLLLQNDLVTQLLDFVEEKAKSTTLLVGSEKISG
jgi:uncharacterized repeat protein (TIGR03837 family)